MKMRLKKQREKTELEKAIDLQLEKLALSYNDDEREQAIRALEVLYSAKEAEDRKNKVTKDALVGAVSSVGGILLILNYERVNVLTSKALSFVNKGRV